MIYQQTLLDNAISPIRPAGARNRSTSIKQRQARSVMFCSSTKSTDAPQDRSTLLKKKRRASSSVPIPDALYRSPSELQLSVDEQVAEERDFVFYARLMSGIRERNRAANQQNRDFHHHYSEETERCLTHIMQTRHRQEQEGEGGFPIPHVGECSDNVAAGGYYLEDLDCVTSCSSSFSSSSTYQHDFEQDRNNGMYCEENECIFDLEL